MPKRSEIGEVVSDFVTKLTNLVEVQAVDRAREAVSSALMISARRSRPHKVDPARKLQGQYMGRLRTFDAKTKAKIKALRAKKGIEAAVAYMERLNSN